MGNILASFSKFALYLYKGNSCKSVLALRSVSTRKNLCRHEKFLVLLTSLIIHGLNLLTASDEDERQWLLESFVAVGLLYCMYVYQASHFQGIYTLKDIEWVFTRFLIHYLFLLDLCDLIYTETENYHFPCISWEFDSTNLFM